MVSALMAALALLPGLPFLPFAIFAGLSGWAAWHLSKTANAKIAKTAADEAMAIWRVFVRTAGLSGMDVEAATDAWVLRRQRMNAVERVSNVR